MFCISSYLLEEVVYSLPLGTNYDIGYMDEGTDTWLGISFLGLGSMSRSPPRPPHDQATTPPVPGQACSSSMSIRLSQIHIKFDLLLQLITTI